jgi:hypothetical protein
MVGYQHSASFIFVGARLRWFRPEGGHYDALPVFGGVEVARIGVRRIRSGGLGRGQNGCREPVN